MVDIRIYNEVPSMSADSIQTIDVAIAVENNVPANPTSSGRLIVAVDVAAGDCVRNCLSYIVGQLGAQWSVEVLRVNGIVNILESLCEMGRQRAHVLLFSDGEFNGEQYVIEHILMPVYVLAVGAIYSPNLVEIANSSAGGRFICLREGRELADVEGLLGLLRGRPLDDCTVSITAHSGARIARVFAPQCAYDINRTSKDYKYYLGSLWGTRVFMCRLSVNRGAMGLQQLITCEVNGTQIESVHRSVHDGHRDNTHHEHCDVHYAATLVANRGAVNTVDAVGQAVVLRVALYAYLRRALVVILGHAERSDWEQAQQCAASALVYLRDVNMEPFVESLRTVARAVACPAAFYEAHSELYSVLAGHQHQLLNMEHLQC